MISDFSDAQDGENDAEATNRRNTMMPGRRNDWRAGEFGHKTFDDKNQNQLHPESLIPQDSVNDSTLKEPTLDKQASANTPLSPVTAESKFGVKSSIGNRLSFSVQNQLKKRFSTIDGSPHAAKDRKRNAEVFLTRVRINALKNDVMAKQGKKPLTIEQRRQIEDKVQQEVLEFHFN